MISARFDELDVTRCGSIDRNEILHLSAVLGEQLSISVLDDAMRRIPDVNVVGDRPRVRGLGGVGGWVVG